MVRCSLTDPEVGMVFRKVGHMVSPPEALFAPKVVGKVLLFRLRRFLGRVKPQQNPSSAPSYVK